MSTSDLILAIQENIEWLETTNGDTVECISIENLEHILQIYLKMSINISQS
jgi:hypothetical protein